jgi:hypothetical protein
LQNGRLSIIILEAFSLQCIPIPLSDYLAAKIPSPSPLALPFLLLPKKKKKILCSLYFDNNNVQLHELFLCMIAIAAT